MKENLDIVKRVGVGCSARRRTLFSSIDVTVGFGGMTTFLYDANLFVAVYFSIFHPTVPMSSSQTSPSLSQKLVKTLLKAKKTTEHLHNIPFVTKACH